MAFSKKYIGKGKQVENMDIVEVSLNMAELQNHTFKYEEETFVKFNVAKLKEPDQYGKNHSVYGTGFGRILRKARNAFFINIFIRIKNFSKETNLKVICSF